MTRTPLSYLDKGYRFIAVTLLSSVLVFAAINLACLPWVKDGPSVEEMEAYALDLLQWDAYLDPRLPVQVDSSYPYLNLIELAKYSLRRAGQFQYSPFSEFEHAAHHSTLINVTNEPFGLAQRISSPPHNQKTSDLTVFCFGGSTTFGSLVGDNDTWPAALQATLREKKTWQPQPSTLGALTIPRVSPQHFFRHC
jgi:hypothetical protein